MNSQTEKPKRRANDRQVIDENMEITWLLEFGHHNLVPLNWLKKTSKTWMERVLEER